MANIKSLPATTSQPQLLAAINTNFRELQNEQVTKLYKDANGIPTIIMGVLPDGTTGIVISAPGVNVLSYFSS